MSPVLSAPFASFSFFHPLIFYIMFAFTSLLLASFFFFNSARAAAIDHSLDTRFHHSSHRWHARNGCQPFTSTFPPSDVSGNGLTALLGAPFVSIGAPGSYSTDGDGLQLFLKKPEGPITQDGHTNSVVGTGATISSTFTVL